MSSTALSWILRPLTPPLAFWASTRAWHAFAESSKLGLATPVPGQMKPSFTESLVTPRLVPASLTLTVLVDSLASATVTLSVAPSTISATNPDAAARTFIPHPPKEARTLDRRIKRPGAGHAAVPPAA